MHRKFWAIALSTFFLPAVFFSALAQSATAPATGKEFKDCSDCPTMVVIPAGSFTMGSPASEKGRLPDEGPQHKVNINYKLAVGKYDVTREEFEKFAAETNRPMAKTCSTMDSGKWEVTDDRSWKNPGFPQTARDPVVCVLYDDARAYVQWMSAKTGRNYRLMSEAEWEYAARAGATTTWAWGDDPQQACQYANLPDMSAQAKWPSWKSVVNCKDGYAFTAPVGTYKPNAFGLYDMGGNVWNWLEDCRTYSYEGAPDDGSAGHNGDCDHRDKRGGSWRCVLTCDMATVKPESAGNILPAAVIRPANRDDDGWGDRSSNGGFRIARLAD